MDVVADRIRLQLGLAVNAPKYSYGHYWLQIPKDIAVNKICI